MLASKAVGRDAATKKYDMLTALAAYALSQDKGTQRLVLRLMVLITARYNWRRDELSMGRKEIARIWSVDERTVKREMAKFRGLDWVTVKRAGARGRVTTYAIRFENILTMTRDIWPAVGPDFVQRMGTIENPEAASGDVIPFTGATKTPPPDFSDGSHWSLASAALYSENETLFGAWFKPLTQTGRAGGCVILEAPSRFHAQYVTTHFYDKILTAICAQDGSIQSVEITA